MENTINAIWKFESNQIKVNGLIFPAEYSIARFGDVFIFAKVSDTPIRIHIKKDMPMYADALKAANAERMSRNMPTAELPAEMPVDPTSEPTAEPITEPTTESIAEIPAEPTIEPTAELPAEMPVEPTSEPTAEPIAELTSDKKTTDKPWIGTSIIGKGWKILFDAETERTRVIFTNKPSIVQKTVVEGAGFYWSSSMKSYNKKLTAKAYRAAVELSKVLNVVA